MNSEDAASLYHQYENFSTSGQWDRACAALGKLLTIEPNEGLLHSLMGNVLRKLEDYTGSEHHFKKAIALDPDDADAFQGLALTYLSMGRAGAADDHIRKAIALDPDDADNWIVMAHLCLHFSDPKQAAYCVERASRIIPEDTRLMELRTRIGATSKGEKKLTPDQQLTGYRQILAKDAENEDAHVQMGLVYFNELRDYEKAEEHFRAALRIDPEDKEDQKLLILALRKRDPVLKFLWAPFKPAEWILRFCEWSWEKKWPLILVLLTGKFLILALAVSFVFFFCVFWPLTKVYEYLTISELHKKMGRLTFHKGPMAWLHRLGFGARFGIFLGILILFWTLLIVAFTSENAGPIIGNIAAGLVAACIICLAVGGWVISIRDRRRDRSRSRKNQVLYESESDPASQS